VDESLLQAILAEPQARAPRLVYADWLEDHGDPLADYVRAECDLITLPPGDRTFGKAIDRLEEVVRSAGTVQGGWEHVLTLDRLLAKMERQRGQDPECKLFGARGHKYVLVPPLAEADLLALERRLGFLLPAEYRAFLLRVCNGKMGPSYGLESIDLAADIGKLTQPCPLTDADAAAALKAMQTGDMDELPDLDHGLQGTLFLANHGGGGYSFLVLSGQQRGKVWAGGDFIAPDFDFGDLTPHGFFSWYEGWLDDALPSRRV
jgi:uncharacterized protein (TIGR02996 family)